MGRRHREQRKRVKAALRREGWYKNEFKEELQKTDSKGSLRARMLYARLTRRQCEYDIIAAAHHRAINDIQEREDAWVFNAINQQASLYEAQLQP